MASSFSATCFRCNGLILQGRCSSCARPASPPALLNIKEQTEAERRDEVLRTQKPILEAIKASMALQVKNLDFERGVLTQREHSFREDPSSENERLLKRAQAKYRRQHLIVNRPIYAKILQRFNRDPGRPAGSIKRRDFQLAIYIALAITSGLVTKAAVMRCLHCTQTTNGRFAKQDRLRLEAHINEGQRAAIKAGRPIPLLKNKLEPAAARKLKSWLLSRIKRRVAHFTK